MRPPTRVNPENKPDGMDHQLNRPPFRHTIILSLTAAALGWFGGQQFGVSLSAMGGGVLLGAILGYGHCRYRSLSFLPTNALVMLISAAITWSISVRYGTSTESLAGASILVAVTIGLCWIDHCRTTSVPLIPSATLMAMAGGMGWGIRGQYGHETGAMIAGVLVGLVIALLYAQPFASLRAARIAALFTLGVSLGGSMTYGQTVGLTHDGPLVGNWEALQWGMLGLFIKGGIWIGFAGAWVGFALSARRYGPFEVARLLIVMMFLWFLGVYFLNEPYDVVNRDLPKIYFSDDWFWEPDSELKPRRERWGGLLVALAGMVGYCRYARRDKLVLRLALWGFVAGGLGFSSGQCIQAFLHGWQSNAWIQANYPVEQIFPFPSWLSYMNWWNWMETTFGTVFGFVFAVGVWMNQHLILPKEEHDPDPALMTPATEVALLAIHLVALVTWNFVDYETFESFADQGVTMIALPVLGVITGRWWPYLMTLSVAILPIAGKTLRAMAYGVEPALPASTVWAIYLVLPMVLGTGLAYGLARRQEQQRSRRFAATALIFTTWMFFGLNIAFFNFSWPWQEWTARTPNTAFFFVDAIGLTMGAVYFGRFWQSPRVESRVQGQVN